MPFLVSAVIALVLAWAGPVNAPGTQGHHIIASLAEQKLTPAAKAKIKRLLALEPGTTLATKTRRVA